jgi:hypothetical protein
VSTAIVKVNKSLNMLQVLYYWYSVIGTVKTGLVKIHPDSFLWTQSDSPRTAALLHVTLIHKSD